MIRTSSRLIATAAALALLIVTGTVVTADAYAEPAKPPAGHDRCAATPSAAEVDYATGKVHELTGRVYRPIAERTSYRPCAALSWAVLGQAGAPTKQLVTLFHDGSFVGLGSICAAPIASIRGDGHSVTVGYPLASELATIPQTAVPVTYTWRDERIVRTGQPPLPLQLQNGCPVRR